MTDKQLETWKAAMESRLNAMQRQIDEADVRSAAHTEGINLLRGDRQRLTALMDDAGVKHRGREFPAPVAEASATRREVTVRHQQRQLEQGKSPIAE